MTPTKLPYAERLALLRELAKITHVCHIDGCDNEAKHRCENHAFGCLSDDDLEVRPADVCDEHWGNGVEGKCCECQPIYGPQTEMATKLNELCDEYMNGWPSMMAKYFDGKYATTGVKIGETITVRMPERWKL